MKVYLAGPEVFLPNARQVLDAKIALARAFGFTPLSPGDLEPQASETKHGFGLAISAVNERLMLDAEMIIANLTPFRGIAADVGTVYELGFMCARGCPAYGFSNVADNHYERLRAYYGGKLETGADGRQRGPDGLSIEDFDMNDNLMLDGGIEARGGVFVTRSVPPEKTFLDLAAYEECLALAAEKHLKRGR